MTTNKKVSILLLVFALSWFLPKNIQAQTNILSLDDAIAMSIAHSRQLKIDSTQLKIADSKIKQSFDVRLPQDRKSTRLNSSHRNTSRMPSSA